MKKKLILVGAMLVAGTNIFAQQQDKETQIEEVTIASKSPQQLYKTGKNVILISEKDLEKYQGQNLNDVLNQTAGIQISGNFNNQTEPKSMKIRGGKSANVIVLLDGVPLKDVTGNDYNAADLRLIALESIASIEILNGASSVLYGSNATVSVINIKTKKAAGKKVEGVLSARAGSFSTYAQDASVRGKINKFNYQISGFNEKSEGISSAEGNDSFDKDGWEKQNISANAGFSSEKFDVNVNGGWNHNLHKYDTGAFTDGTDRNNDQQYFIGGNTNFRYNKGNLVLNVRYTNTERLTQGLDYSSYEDKREFKGDSFFSELYNVYKINDFVNITGGLQYEKQSMMYSEVPWGGNSMEEVLKSDDTYYSFFDVFVNANFSYKNFHLDAGTRMTNHSKFNDHWVYSINPFYLKEMESLYFKVGYSFATAFIAPTLYQNFGTLPFVAPNFDLKPETNQSHEIDLRFGKKDRSLNFNASFFQREEKDTFAYVTIDPVNFIGQYQNVDDNKVKGFEIGMDYKINKFVKLGGNFSYVEKDKEVTMLRIPKQRINSYLEILPFESSRISFSHLYIGSRADSYYDSETYSVKNVEVEGYHLFNLNINQRITPKFNVFLNIGNLFNTSYTDIVGYTTKPRNYNFGFNYSF